MVATVGDTDDQTPPPAASVSVAVPEGQYRSYPLIVPVLGNGLTVTTVVVASVPQLLVTA